MHPKFVRKLKKELAVFGLEVVGNNAPAELLDIDYAAATARGKEILRHVILPEGKTRAMINAWQVFRGGLLSGALTFKATEATKPVEAGKTSAKERIAGAQKAIQGEGRETDHAEGSSGA